MARRVSAQLKFLVRVAQIDLDKLTDQQRSALCREIDRFY